MNLEIVYRLKMKYLLKELTGNDYYSGYNLIWKMNPKDSSVVIFDSQKDADIILKTYFQQPYQLLMYLFVIISLEEAIKDYEIHIKRYQ